MDHRMIRVSQWSVCNGVIGTANCGVTVIQSVPLSGWTLYKLSVFREFLAEISPSKVTENNNKGVRVCLLDTEYMFGQRSLRVLHIGLGRNVNTDQSE